MLVEVKKGFSEWKESFGDREIELPPHYEMIGRSHCSDRVICVIPTDGFLHSVWLYENYIKDEETGYRPFMVVGHEKGDSKGVLRVCVNGLKAALRERDVMVSSNLYHSVEVFEQRMLASVYDKGEGDESRRGGDSEGVRARAEATGEESRTS